MNEQLLHWYEGGSRCFRPTTLTELGKSEEFLEEVIYDNFGLLGLEQGQIGIRGPFQCWRQVSLNTPEGRTIYPDIVAISASGHLIVVEVKLGSNNELKSRKVISQIIDYASSFASASRAELLSMFSRGGSSESTWEGFVGSLFPDLSQIGEMSALLEQRIGDGELNLVIACDKSPLGTRELLRGVAVQAALGFQLDLIEIIPHVDTDGGDGEIVFVPHRSATTEIISRTAVTVLIEEGAAEPGVVVESTSLEEIEEEVTEPIRTRAAVRAEDISPVDVRDDVEALIQGEEGLSDEFKEKASTIFEAAVHAKVVDELNTKLEEIEGEKSEDNKAFQKELTEKVDGYLTYVVEEWMSENELAIDRGIRSELVEDFMSGLRTLFTEHYIDIPEEKVDMVDDLFTKVEDLETSLDEEINRGVELQKELSQFKKDDALRDATKDLADTETEKISKLAEGIEYENEEQYIEKLNVLKESYFPKSDAVTSEITETDETIEVPDEKTEVKLHEDMEHYTSAIKRYNS